MARVSFRAEAERSVAGAVRRWLTGTFAGRIFLAGLGLKLITVALRFGWGLSGGLDTLADVTLLAGALLLVHRVISDVRGALLWRVRRKLTLSYIFIGFVPVLLVIIFFLTAGLILFLNVSQYVALNSVNTVVDQAAFLADSAAIGLDGAQTLDEVRARIARRQSGAARSFPYVSYAIVPARRACSGSLTTTAAWEPVALTAGPWRHLDAPAAIPAWIGCDGAAALLSYAAPRDPAVASASLPVHLVARAVAWPDDSTPDYAVVVDVPLTASLRERLRAATGIEIGGTNAVPERCSGAALNGRDLGESDAVSSPAGSGGLLHRPIDWVAFPSYLVWESGESCGASMRIRTTMAGLYARVSATPLNPGDIGSIGFGTFLLLLLALVGVLFLLIQIAAFIMGLALARSITGSVHELFTGTERVRQGDLTHKIPITSHDQLGELAESFNSMTASIADLLQEKAEKERMEQELRIARSIQMSLLPPDQVTLPGLAVTAHCEPAREVGGDYYDYMKLDDDRLALLIADVSGKGTSAALYMAELKGLMLSLSQLHSSPRNLLIDANRIISKHLDSKSFITITYAVVDVRTRTLTYARAGHCPLIYVPGAYARSRAAQILAPDGLVLGLQIDDEGRRFISLLEEVTLPLGPGDVFLFYTDGLTEAMDPEGDCFGDARLAAIVQEHADAPFAELRERIFSEVSAFAGPLAQQDDMTMLLLRVEATGAHLAAGSAVATVQ